MKDPFEPLTAKPKTKEDRIPWRENAPGEGQDDPFLVWQQDEEGEEMTDNPHLLPKIRSAAIMAAMDGMPCSLRISSFIPGRRCSHPDTVVGCHLPTIGKGMSTKVTDLAVASGCQSCHDLLDGRDTAGAAYLIQHYPTGVATRLTDALVETQARLVGMGIITVQGGEVI